MPPYFSQGVPPTTFMFVAQGYNGKHSLLQATVRVRRRRLCGGKQWIPLDM